MNTKLRSSVSSRSELLRFVGWFATVNALLLGIIGIRFLTFYGWPEGVLAAVYLFFAWVGYYSLLAFLPLLLFTLPVIILWPRRGILTTVAVLVAAFLGAGLLLDSLVYAQNRFHITWLTAQILGWQSWVFFGLYFFIGLLLEAMLARHIWGWVKSVKSHRGGLLATLLVLAIFCAQIIHIWADAAYYTPVTGLSQFLPGYRGVTAKRTMVNLGLVDLNQARERELLRRLNSGSEKGQLNYPLQALECRPPRMKMNVLLILVDAMRYDLFSPETSPNLTHFARQSSLFINHYSGGNSSRIGVFSLFYGLAPGDQIAIESVQQPAVMINQFQKADYRFGIFSSSPLYRPVMLDRTAFANIQNLRISSQPESAPGWQHDQQIVSEWMGFLEQQPAERPFFGFLFFDAVNGSKPPPDYLPKFKPRLSDPMPQKQAKYRQAMHFVDQQIQLVLADLQNRGLLDSTVVLISSDHGEEFNDSGLGFNKHGSAYTHWQLKVPMMIYWPGMKPQEYRHSSSHYDIAPTLLKRVLNCSNPASDYSLGADIFKRSSWPWLLAGSYYNEAVLTSEQIIISFPGGGFEVRQRDYKLIDSPRLDARLLSDIMQARSRFRGDKSK